MKAAALPAAILCLAVGCATPMNARLARDHLLSVDAEGKAIDPIGRDELEGQALEDYVERMLVKADAESDARALSPGDLDPCPRLAGDPVAHRCNKVTRLLIHVHGGLNTMDHSLAASLEMAQQIEAEQPSGAGESNRSNDWYYPIFVTWPSGGPDSYWEHAGTLRQGQHWPLWGKLTAPYYVARDLVVGVLNAPRLWLFQGALDTGLGAKVAFGTEVLPSWQKARRVYETIRPRKPGGGPLVYPTPIRARLYSYSRTWYIQGIRFIGYWTLLPLKLVTSSLVLDGLGTGSWEVMLHRAANLFRPARELEEGFESSGQNRRVIPEELFQEPTGAFAEFLRAFERHRLAVEGERCYQITLVGHSMGTIIINRALRHFRDLPVTRLVYMAAACSISDVEDSVLPFLLRKRNLRTQFHVLTLHPQAEADEINAFDTVPRGSLLEWIDNFFEQTTSLEELRFGKWVNLLQSIHILSPVFERTTIKGFGLRRGTMPQQHGDFNSCPFWRRSFWDPDDGRLYYAGSHTAVPEDEG